MDLREGKPLVELRNVRKEYGAHVVLSDVSLSVNRGEVVCIVGPSGSGKSTILRCINALCSIEGGELYVDGLAVHAPKFDKAALRRKVGMVFQQYNLFPHMTALENIVLGPIVAQKVGRREAEERARQLLAKVRLSNKEKAYPGELSGGQQQRVAIARALALNPQTILFDEVTAALDPEMVKEVLVAIRELASDGITCVLVTHEMRFAREVAGLIYFIDQGRIVESGPPAEFFSAPKDPRLREFLDKVL